ncbi:hypothetical protein RD792_009016 [Penstemon davidsonii]|uniref:RING-type domain-containing protein n=1 Tax=Penstemon davidsonii TaxID=160366 RepID=A0ABR0DAS4_9LAMI|nr:hypothetical protein RD792_009016 [Penstemon davidsonii]
MEVELYTEETSDDENYALDDKIEDFLDNEGERCGICMEMVIDRGVLDCCQHWFCFACIDNWATITSLCPLCQNEFQLITCVPVYDTIGGNKTDEDTDPREDDWFVEGKSNTLSFPSYYIDENAVVCLDGDGCKIRSGSLSIEEDTDIDTSIACDLCDKWYHAFCVGFDPDGTCDSSWLCPRCMRDRAPKKLDRVSLLRQSYQHGIEFDGGSPVEASFSGRVSVSLVDDGETAVVVSLVEENQRNQESSEPVSGCSKDMKTILLCSSTSSSNIPTSEALLNELNSGQQEVELSLSQDNDYSSSQFFPTAQPNINSSDPEKRVTGQLHKKIPDSSLDLDHVLSVKSYISVDMKDDVKAEGEPEYVEPNITSEENSLPAEKLVPNNKEVMSSKNTISDEKETITGVTGAKRKRRDSRNAGGGEKEANSEAKYPQKKIKAEKDSQPTLEPILDDSRTISSRITSKDSKLKSSSEKENGTADIMSIVKGTDRRSLKQLQHKVSSDGTPEERETAAGLRLKKIQLSTLAGFKTENRKPTLDMKAKKSMLQKGKVRESLTKKIYGAGGKRKRAWTRECEVEFWKHRCLKESKPQKVQTLKSVLDLLRDESDNTEKMPGNEVEQRSSVLSRLYLADNSVFPRKNDIKPVSSLNTNSTPEQKRESGLTQKISVSPPIDHSEKIPTKNNNLSQVIATPLDSKELNKSVKGIKVSSEKEVVSKSDITKVDKRKWALELLAKKTATSGKNVQENKEDNVILKGNYSLLAQLPKDMRPVLAPSRHNKIPIAVRQAQLYRLTEHFLKKANLLVVCKTAETELAVADAVNIEKQVADRSNSKLVYVNLCSQELKRRSDNISSDKAKDSNSSDISSDKAKDSNSSDTLFDRASEEANNTSLVLAVDEALRNAGLMSDSPPNSPNHPTDGTENEVGSQEKIEEEGPDNIFEVDSNPELDIYGDFEYDLEDDDFIGASTLNISKLQPEEPKIKMVFSSLNPEKPDETLEIQVHDEERDVEASNGSSCLLDSHNQISDGTSNVDSKTDPGHNSLVDGDEEPSLAECEELYGPDKEPLSVKYPETILNQGLTGDTRDKGSKHMEKDANCSQSKESPSKIQKTENAMKNEKTSKCGTKESEKSNSVVKKVEAYIKEHIRPLCKSGVITIEQYRWAVGKTTEKVMKYHSKEKNANFLIKEGEKVKKLAEQYVESAQQKAKN